MDGVMFRMVDRVVFSHWYASRGPFLVTAPTAHYPKGGADLLRVLQPSAAHKQHKKLNRHGDRVYGALYGIRLVLTEQVPDYLP